jgi:hypothetical protein
MGFPLMAFILGAHIFTSSHEFGRIGRLGGFPGSPFFHSLPGELFKAVGCQIGVKTALPHSKALDRGDYGHASGNDMDYENLFFINHPNVSKVHFATRVLIRREEPTV